MTKARLMADLIDNNGDVQSGSLDNVTIPTLSSLGIANFDQITCDASGNLSVANLSSSGTISGTGAMPTNWTAALSGSDMVFSYSGTAKFKLTTGGAVIAVDDITAFGTV